MLKDFYRILNKLIFLLKLFLLKFIWIQEFVQWKEELFLLVEILLPATIIFQNWN